jgi:uncharacterized protein (DUF302 family)
MTQTQAVEQRSYGLRRTTRLSYADAVEKTRDALKVQGFGVLTEIDVKATLKAKIDVEVAPYIILGACNPPLAYRTLTAEPEVGLLLPCNVVVREAPEGTIIEAMDPEAVMSLVKSPGVAEVAREVKARLSAALASITE